MVLAINVLPQHVDCLSLHVDLMDTRHLHLTSAECSICKEPFSEFNEANFKKIFTLDERTFV